MASVEALASGYGLVEGPCVDGAGGLYFSDVTGGGVYRLTPDGTVETVVPRRRGVGGIALHADGGIVISGRDICHVRDGTSRILFERPDGVGGFNDLATDAAGNVYFGSLRSDPFRLERERTPGECYRIEPGGAVRELYGGIGLSNGIGVSPDGKHLYHCDTAAGEIVAHELGPDGVAGRRVFARCGEGPDGMAVDEEGGVWVALYGGGRVQRFTPAGRADVAVPVAAKMVASVCFGGADRRDLYVVTADNTDDPARGGTIFRTRVDVPGLALPPARV